jgi:hypothetical protein
MTTDTKRYGLLLVMMDPPAADEQEFHDWYDNEHVPERAQIPGFRTVQRFVCLEGWPRYMALYDLDHIGVLKEPAYAAVSGAKFSPWSKRIISAIHGWTRTEAVQIAPGTALTGQKGVPLRVAVLRLRDVSAGQEDKVAVALKAFLSERPEVLQWRLFQATAQTGSHLYAVVELSAPVTLAAFNWRALSLPSGSVDIANLYSRYWRREP